MKYFSSKQTTIMKTIFVILALLVVLAAILHQQVIPLSLRLLVTVMAYHETHSPTDTLALSPRARAFNKILAFFPGPSHLPTLQQYRDFVSVRRFVHTPLNKVNFGAGERYERQKLEHGLYFVDKACTWIDPSITPETRPVILYVHGGGLIAGTPETHASAIVPVFGSLKQCADLLFARYRLLPEHTIEDALSDVQKAYQFLSTKYQKIILMGDSAGGALVVNFATKELQNDKRLDSLVLLSPALDLAFSIESDGSLDYLVTEGVVEANRKYVVGTNESYIRSISPLNQIQDQGDKLVLPRTFISYSTTERTARGTEEFYALLNKNGKDNHLVGKYGLQHTFQLFPEYFPEAYIALKQALYFAVGKTLTEFEATHP